MAIDEAAKYEIDFRLRQKEGEFQQAALLAKGIKIEVLADDGVVVPGQPVKVNVIVANRGTGDVAIKQVKFDGFEGDAACDDDGVHRRRLRFPGGGRGGRGGANAPPAAPMSSVRRDQVAHCEPTLTIPANARVDRAVLASRGRGRPLHVRRRRAVRPADAADAVLRAGHAGAAGRRRGRSTGCRCSIATRATSSAARSGPSCWSCRRCRCACRPRSRSFRRRRSARCGRRRRARTGRRPPHRPHGRPGRDAAADAPPPARGRADLGARGPRHRRQRHDRPGGERR